MLLHPDARLCLQADFSFFFDTGGRRRCYVAPERFYTADAANVASLSDAAIQPSMVRPVVGFATSHPHNFCRRAFLTQ